MDIVYRNKQGGLSIGKDSDSAQLSAAVYRSRKGFKIVKRGGTFVEVATDGSGERMLFPASQ